MKAIQQTNKETSKGRKKRRGDANYSERVRTKWFCCAFNLGFLQLVCKDSLILSLTENQTGYIVQNKTFLGEICILTLRNKRKIIFARGIGS